MDLTDTRWRSWDMARCSPPGPTGPWDPNLPRSARQESGSLLALGSAALWPQLQIHSRSAGRAFSCLLYGGSCNFLLPPGWQELFSSALRPYMILTCSFCPKG